MRGLLVLRPSGKGERMYIVKEKTCSTCSHWFGLRAMEENGFVYSLENLEGMCKGVKHDTDGNGFDRTDIARFLLRTLGSVA